MKTVVSFFTSFCPVLAPTTAFATDGSRIKKNIKELQKIRNSQNLLKRAKGVMPFDHFQYFEKKLKEKKLKEFPRFKPTGAKSFEVVFKNLKIPMKVVSSEKRWIKVNKKIVSFDYSQSPESLYQEIQSAVQAQRTTSLPPFFPRAYAAGGLGLLMLGIFAFVGFSGAIVVGSRIEDLNCEKMSKAYFECDNFLKKKNFKAESLRHYEDLLVRFRHYLPRACPTKSFHKENLRGCVNAYKRLSGAAAKETEAPAETVDH